MALHGDAPPVAKAHWMKDIKRQIQRDVQKGAGPLRNLKSVIVQAKVGLILEQHNRMAMRPIGARTGESMNQALAEVDAKAVLTTPSLLLKRKAPQDPEALLLTERLLQEMRRRGTPELTVQMITSYVAQNLERVVRRSEQLRLSQQQLAQKLRKEALSKSHKHVYPHDVMQAQFCAAAGDGTVFPKKVMHESDHGLRVVRSGHRPDPAEIDEAERLERTLSLMPIGLYGAETAVEPSVSSGHVFGQHLPSSAGPPRIVLNSGTCVEFDPNTVATATVNNCALLHAIVAAQDRLFGGSLVVPELTLKEVEAEKQRSAPPPQKVMSRVKSFRQMATTPSVAQRRATIFNMRVPVLAASEVDLMFVRGSRRSVSGGPVDTSMVAPQSLLETLLLTIVDEDLKLVEATTAAAMSSSAETEYDPLCVVCQSSIARRASPSSRTTSPPRSPVRRVASSMSPSAYREHAESLLLKWKASHDYVSLRQAEDLQKAIALRGTAQLTVHQSAGKWVKVAHKAVQDAKQWCVARSSSPPPSERGSPSPLPGSIWEEPSEELISEARSVSNCLAFWARLRHFLGLVQCPQTDEGVAFLENLRQLLLAARAVDRLVLLRWLHLCGPRVTKQREHFRVVQFVRVLLNIPLPLLVKWGRLPHIRNEGFDISED